MHFYKRNCENKKINICVSDTLFDGNGKLFSSIFKTFSKELISQIPDNTLYLCSIEEKNGNKSYPCIFCDTKNPQWKYWLMYEVESWIINCLDCTVLHSAGIQLCGKTITLIGQSLSGKSTLTHYLCSQEGGKYLDDDCVYLYKDKIWGFNFPMALRAPQDYCQGIIGYTDDAVMKNRCLVDIDNNIQLSEKIDIILFPHYNKYGENTIEKVPASNLYVLILNNIRHKKNMAALYSDAGHIISGVRGYDLSYTSSDNAINLIKRIL